MRHARKRRRRRKTVSGRIGVGRTHTKRKKKKKAKTWQKGLKPRRKERKRQIEWGEGRKLFSFSTPFASSSFLSSSRLSEKNNKLISSATKFSLERLEAFSPSRGNEIKKRENEEEEGEEYRVLFLSGSGLPVWPAGRQGRKQWLSFSLLGKQGQSRRRPEGENKRRKRKATLKGSFDPIEE